MKYVMAIFIFLMCTGHFMLANAESKEAIPTYQLQVDKAIEKLKKKVNKIKVTFNKKYPKENYADPIWIKEKLNSMVESDQLARHFSEKPGKEGYNQEKTQYFIAKIFPEISKIDKENTGTLKNMLTHYRWITISKFGKEADRNAWLITQHADLDKPFQDSVLAILKTLYKTGETNKKSYAYLYDRVNINEGKPQKYGTQIACTTVGTMVVAKPYPIEDRKNLDKRRKAMNMKPVSFEKYFKMAKHGCKDMLG